MWRQEASNSMTEMNALNYVVVDKNKFYLRALSNLSPFYQWTNTTCMCIFIYLFFQILWEKMCCTGNVTWNAYKCVTILSMKKSLWVIFFKIMWEKNVLYFKFVTILSMKKNIFIFFKPSGGKICCTTTECVAVVVLYNLMNGFS